MDKLNIGVVCYPSYGGSGVIATELGMAVAKRGHSVHFISYDTPFRLTGFDANIQFHEVTVQSYPLFKYPPYTLALTSKIIEVCQLHKLDILHVHYAIPHSICAFLSKQIMCHKNMKIITTLHGTDITLVGLDKSYYKIVQFGILQSDEVTSVSGFLKDLTIQEFDIDKKIHVIPNFVDTNRFTPEQKNPQCRCLSGEEREKLVVHISNFRPVKNIDIVIKTFHLIQKEVKAKLALIGDGPEILTARETAMELGIMDSINFLGKLDQVEDILPYADLILLPSKTESFGLAILEAMSCGVPAIGSNVGGIPEVIQDGKTGFMFPPSDYQNMAKKGIEILSQPQLQQELSVNARKIAEDCFNQEKVVDQYERLYFDTFSN